MGSESAPRRGFDVPGQAEAGSGERFAGLLRNLWRAQVRVTRSVARLPELPESQVDLLRLLVQAGPMTPAELADRLRLARPTVSNVLRDLRGSGLIERQQAPDDGRSVIVVATDRAAEIFDTFARTRLAALEAIMARLDQPDRDQIEAALPAMERLLHEFDAELQRIDHLPPEGEKESTDD
ncbi:MAG: MarR family transcriptional regulator [Micropruina glycogenica]